MIINGKDIKVFVCASGTGKTYFSKINSEFIDVDKFKYLCKQPELNANLNDIEIEKLKDKVCKKSVLFPNNFIAMINDFYKSGKNLLVVPEPLIMDLIHKNGWKYVLIYPNKDLKEEYKGRLLNRGNSKEFTMWHDMFFDKYFEQYEKDSNATFKIKLGSNEYVSDVISRLKDN